MCSFAIIWLWLYVMPFWVYIILSVRLLHTNNNNNNHGSWRVYAGRVSLSYARDANAAPVQIERANKLWILWNDLDNGLLVAADDNNDDALRVKENTGFRYKILRLRVLTLEI